jgi:hypothetical protein
MSINDKIADIIAEHWCSLTGNIDQHDMADAILEALPDMIAPLVWMRNGSHWVGGHGYVVRKLGSQYTLTIRNQFEREFNELDEALTHAATHHRAAIMAAFTGETS